VKALLKKLKKAVKGRWEAKEAYDGLGASIDKKLIEEWRVQEAKAMSERGDALKIFEVQEEKGEICLLSIYVRLNMWGSSDTE
jgi:hypothetical protein